MNDNERKIKDLEKQNKEFYKLLKELDKKTFHLLWMWALIPFLGFVVWQMKKMDRKSKEPYYSNAVKIKVEIAKNEIEIIKLKKNQKH